MGDHEPARFVSGVEGFGCAVAHHRPGRPCGPICGLDWAAGLLPDPATPSLPMDALRDLLLSRLSAEARTMSARACRAMATLAVLAAVGLACGTKPAARAAEHGQCRMGGVGGADAGCANMAVGASLAGDRTGRWARPSRRGWAICGIPPVGSGQYAFAGGGHGPIWAVRRARGAAWGGGGGGAPPPPLWCWSGWPDRSRCFWSDLQGRGW